MDGVTTAIVLAVFAGVFWPHAIKNRQQFYFAIGAVLLIILFGVLDNLILSVGFHRFVAVIHGLLQFIGILGIILAASGQSVGEFASDTIEVMRRGEEETEILIKGAGTRRAARERDEVDESGRIDLGSTDALSGKAPLRQNVPPPPPPPSAGEPAPAGAAPPSAGPIPLDE
jgi:hypothetical protein